MLCCCAVLCSLASPRAGATVEILGLGVPQQPAEPEQVKPEAGEGVQGEGTPAAVQVGVACMLLAPLT
jgi:hypothetical protein